MTIRPTKRCPETKSECFQKFSCEHTPEGAAVVCMKANVRRYIEGPASVRVGRSLRRGRVKR